MLIGEITMGLDAYVYCNCYTEGKTTMPPVAKELLYVDDEGCLSIHYPSVMAKEERWVLADKLAEWEKSCCDHYERRAYETRISNWFGVRKFQDAVIKANKYPTLESIIPEGNGGCVEATQSPQVLAELEDFCNRMGEVEGVFLIDAKTGETIYSCLSSIIISWQDKEKLNIGFDSNGLFVMVGETKADFNHFVDTKGSYEMESTAALEQFRSKHFTREFVAEEERTDNRDRTFKVRLSLLTDIETKEQYKVEFLSECPEMFEFKVITRPYEANDFGAIKPLRQLLKASIETGNPIYWT